MVLPLFLMALFTCEDLLTPLIEEDVRVAKLPDRVLSILPPSDGTVVPQGTMTVKDNEPLEVAATPNGGYYLHHWLQTDGTGVAIFTNVNAASTTVRVTGGNATIQPQILETPRNLTITNDGHGTTNPAGAIFVAKWPAARNQCDSRRSIWVRVQGLDPDERWPGTASFDSATSASTNVTVTGGDATIRANFQLKHYTITLTNDTHGTTSPSGTLDLTHGIASVSISTSPATGYRFKNWTVHGRLPGSLSLRMPRRRRSPSPRPAAMPPSRLISS